MGTPSEQLIESTKTVSEACEKLKLELNTLTNEIASRIRSVKGLHEQLRELETEQSTLVEGLDDLRLEGSTEEDELVQIDSLIFDVGSKIKKLKPSLRSGRYQNISLFLRLLIGNVDLTFWNQETKLKFRQEYILFREQGLYLYVLLPLIQVILGYSKLIYAMQHFWFGYYYISLAVRENILYQNGSRIRRWWIDHHIISVFISVLGLMQTDVEGYIDNHGRATFYLGNLFVIFQGVTMFLQNQYQKQRFYTRVALGKANALDLPQTEVIDEKVTSLSLQTLVYMSSVIYIVEFIVGLSFLWACGKMDSGANKVYVALSGLLFIVLAGGNASALWRTMQEKGLKKTSSSKKLV